MAEYINLGRTDDKDASLDPIKGSTDAISIHGLKYVVGNKTYNFLLSDDLTEYGDNDHVGPKRGETDGRANMSVTNASVHGPLNLDRQANLTNQYYHRYTNYKMNSDGTISTDSYAIPSGYDYFETSTCLDDHCDYLGTEGNKYYYCSSHTRSDLKNTQHGYSKYSDTTCSWTKRNITLHFLNNKKETIATDSQSYWDYVNGTKATYSIPGYNELSEDRQTMTLYDASSELVYGTVTGGSPDYEVDVTATYSVSKTIACPTIAINPTFMSLTNTNELTLTLTCSDESVLKYFDSISWESSDESIVKVDHIVDNSSNLKCVVKPTGTSGICTITAKLGNSSAACVLLTPESGVSYNDLYRLGVTNSNSHDDKTATLWVDENEQVGWFVNSSGRFDIFMNKGTRDAQTWISVQFSSNYYCFGMNGVTNPGWTQTTLEGIPCLVTTAGNAQMTLLPRISKDSNTGLSYIVLIMMIKNLTDSTQTFDWGFGTDSDVDDVDTVPVYDMPYGILISGSKKFQLRCYPADGINVTPADKWACLGSYGNYNSYNAAKTQNDPHQGGYYTYDSGYCWWYQKTLGAYETKVFDCRFTLI